MKKNLVVITGAGISAESGIKTFRDSGGLWENHDINDVATPEGWMKNPQLVLDFYNYRRKELGKAVPNPAHTGLADLEKEFEVHIITQNVDNLHERGGSTKVLHLHGELTKACDEFKQTVVDIGYDEIKIGEKLNGSQMRPFIVWFGEAVPAIEEAISIVRQADIVAIIGTSLQVYPAAGLINYAPAHAPIYLIDPNDVITHKKITFIQKKATEGVAELKRILQG